MELFLRSFAPSGANGRQREVLNELHRLDHDGVVDADVTVWGNRICPTAASVTEEGTAYLHTIATFRRWADEAGASFGGAFESHTSRSLVDAAYEVIVPPVMCLAVYEDDSLWGVFPCTREGQDWTVADCLASFSETHPPTDATDDVRTRWPSRADD